jgi:hypothetical protein
MKIAICTLFEGHYHHGGAALINSLYNNGFRGDVYIGYRGGLPFWGKDAQENNSLNWKGSKTIKIEELDVHFLPVISDYHMTNYKPDFVLDLLEGPAKEKGGIFYFDPDIVVNCKFSFYEEWIQQGVALVHEITANDMTSNNPVRGMWKKIIEENGEKVNHQLNSYINAGFFGLVKENIHFVKMYSKFIHLADKKYKVDLVNFSFTNRIDPFFAKDQDALNIAAMSANVALSEIGPEGMDFIHGGFTMSHAIGSPKPWVKNFIKSSLKGNPPSMAEKSFWNHVGFPIKTFSEKTKKNKKKSIKIASLIGKFYKKY